MDLIHVDLRHKDDVDVVVLISRMIPGIKFSSHHAIGAVKQSPTVVSSPLHMTLLTDL